MKFEHRIYSTPNMFGLSYHYELIGEEEWSAGQLQYPLGSKITLANFRQLRKQLVQTLERP